MADHHPNSAHTQRAPKPTSTISATFRQPLHQRSSSPRQLLGFFTLLTLGFASIFLAAAFLSTCGFVAVVVAASSWIYRYFRGLRPPGSDRVDYARSRIYDTASHVKECAWEYGGYLQGMVKDAAPGA